MEKEFPTVKYRNDYGTHPHVVSHYVRNFMEIEAIDWLSRRAVKSILDIGGNAARAHKVAQARKIQYHSANPELSTADTLRRLSFGELSCFCSHRAEECDCMEYEALISVHSIYYLSTEMLGTLIERSRKKMLLAVMHMFHDPTGKYPTDMPDGSYRRENGRIVMSVAGNNFSYTHPDPKWCRQGTSIMLLSGRRLVWTPIREVFGTTLMLFTLSDCTDTDVPLTGLVEEEEKDLRGLRNMSDMMAAEYNLERIKSVYEDAESKEIVTETKKLILPTQLISEAKVFCLGKARNHDSWKSLLGHLKMRIGKLNIPHNLQADVILYSAFLGFVETAMKEQIVHTHLNPFKQMFINMAGWADNVYYREIHKAIPFTDFRTRDMLPMFVCVLFAIIGMINIATEGFIEDGLYNLILNLVTFSMLPLYLSATVMFKRSITLRLTDVSIDSSREPETIQQYKNTKSEKNVYYAGDPLPYMQFSFKYVVGVVLFIYIYNNNPYIAGEHFDAQFSAYVMIPFALALFILYLIYNYVSDSEFDYLGPSKVAIYNSSRKEDDGYIPNKSSYDLSYAPEPKIGTIDTKMKDTEIKFKPGPIPVVMVENTIPLTFANDADTAEAAIRTRTLQGHESGGWEKTSAMTLKHWDYLIPPDPEFRPVNFETWLSECNRANDKQRVAALRKAHQAILDDPEKIKFKVNGFVKSEFYANKALDAKPRMIFATTDEYLVATAPAIHSLGKRVKQHLNSESMAYYTSGANGLDLGDFVDWSWESLGQDSHIIEIDFTAFEGNISEDVLEWNAVMYEHLGLSKEMADRIRMQKVQVGRTQSGLKWKRKGGKASAVADTSLGNTLDSMHAAMAYFLRMAPEGTPEQQMVWLEKHFRIMDLGDDNWILVSNHLWELMGKSTEAYKNYYKEEVQWQPEMKDYSYADRFKSEFCSGWFVEFEHEGYLRSAWTPKLGRVLRKTLFVKSHEKKPHQVVKGICLGLTQGVTCPLLHKTLRALADKIEGPCIRMQHLEWNPVSGKLHNIRITPDGFCQRYDMDVTEYGALKNYLTRQMYSDKWPINLDPNECEVIRKVMNRDLGELEVGKIVIKLDDPKVNLTMVGDTPVRNPKRVSGPPKTKSTVTT